MGNKGKPEVPPLSPNSACAQNNLQGKFLKFLQYVEKKGELSSYLDHSSSTYTIKVSYNQIFAFNDIELIMETCNMLNRSESFFLPAAQKFVADRSSDEIIYMTCLSFIDYPASVQKFPEFISSDLLYQSVQVLSSNRSILATTPHGRLLMKTLMVALLKYHLEGISWDGAFNITDMVVIDFGHPFKQLKILKAPVEADTCMQKLHEAMVKDLQRVSELIIPYYKGRDGAMPVYFSQLKEDLDGVTIELVAEPWFRDYLSSHVAFMSSIARRNLEIMLYDTYKIDGDCYIHFFLAKPTVYPSDWRKALMKHDEKYINGLFSKVHSYGSSHQLEIDQYDNSVYGLMKFKAIFLVQCGQGHAYVNITESEPELYAADMFSDFLPSLVYALLKQGFMESVFGKGWEDFKEPRSVKSDP